MLASSQHALHFGDLLVSLGQQGGYADHGVFRLALLANGYEVGSPQQVVNAVESQLFDGDLEEIARYGNREMTFRVEVSAADGEALAQGEKALMAQLGRPNTLRWLPPVPPVAPTVFDVLTSWMEVTSEGGADLDELRCVRVYEITARCMPFGRGETEVVTPAIASGGGSTVTPTVAVISAATSLTTWSGTANGASVTPTLDNGVKLTGVVNHRRPPLPVSLQWRYNPEVPIVLSGFPWVRVKMTSAAAVGNPQAVFTLVDNSTVALAPEIIDGDFAYFKTSFAQFKSLAIQRGYLPAPIWTPGGITGDSASAAVQELARQDVFPIIGTGRQLMRTLEVGGSAPTQGSMLLEHASTALGPTIVYTNSEDGRGYQPAIGRSRASGGTLTTDASTMSGRRAAMVSTTPETFDVPMANLQPGDYALIARLRATGTAGNRSITATVSPRIGTSNLAVTGISGTYNLPTTWGFHAIGERLLSIDPAAAPGGVFRVMLAADNTELDDAYLFNTTTGSLVWVDCGTGTPAAGGASSRLWIDSPTVESPWPRIRVGSAADGSDARHISMSAIKAMDALNFPVGTMNVFTACEALNAACSLRHYERAHTNMAAS